MTKADHVVERGAERLQKLSDKAAARGGGVGEWLAEELANDAAFLRKLKPSLIKARAQRRGADEPGTAARPRGRSSARPRRSARRRSEAAARAPLRWSIVGAALVAGVVLAKVIDWRGHAHPRD